MPRDAGRGGCEVFVVTPSLLGTSLQLPACCPGASGRLAGPAPVVSVVAPILLSAELTPRCPLPPQTENGVLLPSLQSALPFLDLHGTPRLEFHQSVFDELRDKLLERVSAIASEGKAEDR